MMKKPLPKIVIIDYGLGNLFNVLKALQYQEIHAAISRDPEDLREADGAILPGVGAFKDGMEGLVRGGFVKPILDFVSAGRPFLGICLGTQMLMEESFEMGRHQGLGLLPGSVLPFEPKPKSFFKIPHMGWNRIEMTSRGCSDPFMADTQKGAMFYFVHSYFVAPRDSSMILAETEYGDVRFCSILGKRNLYGCQFHPEKSGAAGLQLLSSFAKQIRSGVVS